jgi:tol-pal system protein YbgF
MKRLLLLTTFLFAGHASAALFSDDDAQAKIAVLKQENQQLKDQVKALEDRITKLDNTMRSQGLLDLLQQVETLKNDMAKLRGQVEVNTYNVGTTDKRQKDLYVDLDNRMRKLERVGGTPETPAMPPAASAAASTPAAADPSAENRAYDSAFNLFKIGNYQAAIAGFQSFTKTYPKSPLASNAQYWIGNSYSALRDFKNCIANQKILIAQYPDSPKAPDAMLNLASCQFEAGEKDIAKKTLEDLLARHPTSGAADAAKKRLANLK